MLLEGIMKFKNKDEVKVFLKKYNIKKQLAKSLYKQYKEMEAVKNEAGGIAALRLDGMPKKKGKVSDPVYNTYSKAEKLKKIYFKELYFSLVYLEISERLIKITDLDEQDLLKKFYILKQRPEDIAEELHISEATVFRKLGSGIEKIFENNKVDSE